MSLDKANLESIREQLIDEATVGLAKHNRALGAMELIDYLLAQLAEEKEDGIGNIRDSGGQGSDDQAGPPLVNDEESA
jgi:hypothetical protein